MSEPTTVPAADMAVLLQEPKLRELVEELYGVANKWYYIGLHLDIPPDALDKICGDDLGKALRLMLREWEKREEPSWSAVVKALQSQSVGEYRLAKNLQDRYIGRASQHRHHTRDHDPSSEIDGGAFPPIDPSRIHIYHNKVLMNGDSTVVCKAHFLTLPCAAKYVHQKLAKSSAWQLENFKKGCRILKACRHPNIVTCLDIHSDNRLGPILLMELMDQSLRQLIEHNKVDLPLYLQLDLCSDVAHGLEYLHAIDIIHGNLTATNVLVKEGRAKICGAMSLQLRTTNAELSRYPGAPGSMPRRSFSHSDYDEAIDCFSFGVLGIHVTTRELPKPRTQLHDECSEVERYEESLHSVPKGHLLLPLILKCLNDEGYQRPSAAKLCEELLDMINTSDYRNSLQIEYMQDRLHEKTAENTVLQKYRQAKLNTANRETESPKNTVAMENQNLKKSHIPVYSRHERTKIKKQKAEAVSEKDRMHKDPKARTNWRRSEMATRPSLRRQTDNMQSIYPKPSNNAVIHT